MKLPALAPALVFLYSVVVIAIAPDTAIAASTTIIPGQGIGPAAVGGSLFDVIRVLGNPKTTGVIQTSGTTRYRWYEVTFTSPTTSSGGGGLFVDARSDGTIVVVGVFYGGPDYVLENGLRTRSRSSDDGSREADIRRVMGEPRREYDGAGGGRGLEYPGVIFWVSKGHQLIQIDVMTP